MPSNWHRLTTDLTDLSRFYFGFRASGGSLLNCPASTEFNVDKTLSIGCALVDAMLVLMIGGADAANSRWKAPVYGCVLGGFRQLITMAARTVFKLR